MLPHSIRFRMEVMMVIREDMPSLGHTIHRLWHPERRILLVPGWGQQLNEAQQQSPGGDPLFISQFPPPANKPAPRRTRYHKPTPLKFIWWSDEQYATCATTLNGEGNNNNKNQQLQRMLNSNTSNRQRRRFQVEREILLLKFWS